MNKEGSKNTGSNSGFDRSPAAIVKPLKILLVDDERANREALGRALEKYGYETIPCSDSAKAFRVLEESGPALLLLDYQMPELTGAQICEIIRKDPNPDIAETPIIFLTAMTDVDHELECLQAGADDFVTKPVNPAVLRARIETHLRLFAMRQQLKQQNAELEKWRQNQELDLEAARLTQQAILPSRMPAFAGWSFAAYYNPMIQVGGDIYDWLRLPDGGLLAWIADATGHGASAALVTTLTKLLFRNGAAESSSPAEIMHSVDTNFHAIFKGKTFMTAGCVALHADSGLINFCGAGHPPLLIARRDGRIESMLSSGPPVGLNRPRAEHEQKTSLEQGDAFLLYTDGFYGVLNSEGERLTQEQFAQSLEPARDDVDGFLAGIVEKITAHACGETFPDDIAAFAAARSCHS